MSLATILRGVVESLDGPLLPVCVCVGGLPWLLAVAHEGTEVVPIDSSLHHLRLCCLLSLQFLLSWLIFVIVFVVELDLPGIVHGRGVCSSEDLGGRSCHTKLEWDVDITKLQEALHLSTNPALDTGDSSAAASASYE